MRNLAIEIEEERLEEEVESDAHIHPSGKGNHGDLEDLCADSEHDGVDATGMLGWAAVDVVSTLWWC